MSDSEEREDSDRTEDEEDELFEASDHRQQLTAALKWITTTIGKRAAGQGGTKKAKITEEEVDDFFRLYSGLTDNNNQDTPTILNEIVNLVLSNMEASIESSSVKALVQRLVKQCTHFLYIRNDEQQNPLYLAITKKKRLLVDYMVLNCPEDDSGTKCLVEALEDSRANEKRKNCLHLAFEKDMKPKDGEPATLLKMVRVASIKTLEAVDTTGRRPMHYAVQYKNCHVDVIRKFIERDQELVKDQGSTHPRPQTNTFLDTNEKTKASVYQEHVASAAAHIDERNSSQGIPDHHRKRGGLSTGGDGRGNRAPGDEATRGVEPIAKSKTAPKVESKSDNKAARPAPANPAASRDPKGLSDRTGRPRDRDRDGRMGDDEDTYDRLESIREELKQEEKARREALEHTSGARDASRDRRSLDPTGSRNALRVQTAFTSASVVNPSSDVAANTPKPLKRVSTMRVEIADSRSGSKARRATAVTKKSRKVDSEAAARASKTVLRMLKLHYMRTRGIEVATAWLYGTNPQDVQTCFEQPRLPSELKAAMFEKAFQNTRFDNILKFVHFPNVKVILQKSARSKSQQPCDGIGRLDMKFFFDFLYGKEVRSILKVFVEEGGQSVHSDAAIKHALRQISVEHLDWQKIDLDPEIICNIGSEAEYSLEENKAGELEFKNQLRTLDLHWSGTSAVLRAWSEPEGLPSLPHLKTVNVIIPDSVALYDSTDYIQRRVDEFEKRLNKNIVSGNQRKITVNLDGLNSASVNKGMSRLAQSGATQGRTATSVIEKVINTHEWLTTIDAFATSTNELWISTRNAYFATTGVPPDKIDDHIRSMIAHIHRPGRPSCPEDEVVVALIDDGVSLLDQQFVGRVLEGKTFDYDNGVIGQPYNSARGHGTEMARNILRVCPMAKIYPIRLKVQDSVDRTKTEINLKSAAMAIYAALEKNATIISMSWTIPIPKDPDPAEKLFEDAVREACKRNVLMFCSSPDGGQFVNIADYPSAVQRDKMFRIGAAHDYGSASESTDRGVDFILPGVNVNTNTATPATGSSVATALAAGLAATIIYCFKISALAAKTQTQTMSSDDISRRNIREQRLQKIFNHAEMKIAFNSIGTITPSKFIQVWEVLDTVVEKLESSRSEEHKDAKVEAINDLCTKMMWAPGRV